MELLTVPMFTLEPKASFILNMSSHPSEISRVRYPMCKEGQLD